MQTSSQTTVNVNNYPNGLFPAAQGPGVQGRRHLETANCVCLPPGNGGNVANDAGADNSDPSSRTPQFEKHLEPDRRALDANSATSRAS